MAGRDGRVLRGPRRTSTRRGLRPARPDFPTPTDRQQRPRMTDFTAVKNTLRSLRIETPSWAYGNSGTRFKVFAQPGAATRPVREDRRRGDRQPLHRLRADGGAPHPLGPGRPLRGPRGSSPPSRASRIGSDQREHLPGRGLPARQRLQPRPADPAQGHRPPARVRRDRGADRLAAPDPVVRRRHQLRRPGLDQRAPGPPRRRARRDVRGDARRASRCCSSTSSSSPPSTPPTCPTGARACCTASASASGRRCWSTPATTRRARTSR